MLYILFVGFVIYRILWKFNIGSISYVEYFGRVRRIKEYVVR